MRDSADQNVIDESVVFPPRFWWLKRSAMASVAFLVILVAAWLVWSWDANRRLSKAISEITSRGEPVWPADLAMPPVADSGNAALHWQAAEDAVNRATQSPSQSNDTYAQYPPFPAQWHRRMRSAASVNKQALALARIARGFNDVYWNVPQTTPLFAVTLPRFNESRNLANLLADMMLHEHLRGNDAEALELFADLSHQSRTLARQPFLIMYLVATGIDFIALNRLMVIAPALQVAEAEATSADRATVERLIRVLLESSDDNGLARALRSERVLQIDLGHWRAAQTKLLSPLLRRSTRRALGRTDVLIAAASMKSNVVSRELTDTLEPLEERGWINLSGPSRRAPRFSRGFDDWFGGRPRVLLFHHRLACERRFAAVSLAIRLFRIDHDRWPASLDELVPTHLPYVPRDPLAADAPLGYLIIPNALPNGSDRPILYSVDEDGVDDTAAGWQPVALEPTYAMTNRRANTPGDQWRDVSRWAPATQPGSSP